MGDPGWLSPLLDAEQMRSLDEWAITERAVPVLELMEAAGAAIADAATELAPSGRIVAVCGKGNNGGDGLVAVRRLRERGLDAVALLLGDRGDLSEPAAANADRLGDALEPFSSSGSRRLSDAALIIDAIFGTGFSGDPRSPADEAIAAINAGSAAVVAADIPSGVDASTGTAAASSVRADLTVAFHSAKLGHWITPGKGLRGKLRVVAIGIPPDGEVRAAAGLIEEGVLGELPRRGASSDKFSAGSVGMIGGSQGLTGALCMAARSASRAGAGYVTCAVPASLEPIFETKLTEQMTVACPDEDGSLTHGAAERAAAALGRVGAAVIGPGVGEQATAQSECRKLIAELESRVVVDAQGLGALAGHLGCASGRRPGSTVLTPHEGEAARLLDRERRDVSASRLESARELATRAGSLVVLKGDDTIVTDGELIAISPGGAPALASAGSGDVLAGMIGALIARGVDPFEAACAAVVAHLRAGRQAATALGGADGVVASDLIEELPRALSWQAHP